MLDGQLERLHGEQRCNETCDGELAEAPLEYRQQVAQSGFDGLKPGVGTIGKHLMRLTEAVSDITDIVDEIDYTIGLWETAQLRGVNGRIEIAKTVSMVNRVKRERHVTRFPELKQLCSRIVCSLRP